MKKLMLSIFCLSLMTIAFSQNPFKGFFKPIENPKESNLKSAVYAPDSTVWLFRPTIMIDAIKLQYVEGSQGFVNSSFQTLGTGLSYQKFTNVNGSPYCKLAVNLIALYNMDFSGQVAANFGGAVTVGILNNLVSAGLGMEHNQKYPFILLNVHLNLNK